MVENTFGIVDAIILLVIAYSILSVFFKTKKKLSWKQALQWPLQLKKSDEEGD